MPKPSPTFAYVSKQFDTVLEHMRKAEADRKQFRHCLDMIILKIEEAQKCFAGMGEKVIQLEDRMTALEHRLNQ